jgi:hypothetical protein
VWLPCALALGLAPLTGCGEDDDDAAAPDAGIDAATDAGRDAAVDAAFQLSCACDGTEDCAGCFANIGRCCYEGDETIKGAAPTMSSRCARSPTCQVCCSECAAMSCEDLVATNSCPPFGLE